MFIAIVFIFLFGVHAGKMGQFTNFIVLYSGQHCYALRRSVHGFVSLVFARGRHCYAGRATC